MSRSSGSSEAPSSAARPGPIARVTNESSGSSSVLYRHSPITSAERANAIRAVSASRLAVVSCVVMATRSVTSLITMMRDPSSGEMPTDAIAGKRSPLLRRKVDVVLATALAHHGGDVGADSVDVLGRPVGKRRTRADELGLAEPAHLAERPVDRRDLAVARTDDDAVADRVHRELGDEALGAARVRGGHDGIG